MNPPHLFSIRVAMDECRRAAVILNAGCSTRMGRSKASLPFHTDQDQTTTFLDRAIQLARVGTKTGPIILVCSQHTAPESARDFGENLVVAINPRPQRGMFSSVQTGLAQCSRLCSQEPPVMVLLMDHPLVKPDTILYLWAAFEATPNAVIVPRYRERRGHPIILPPRTVSSAMAATVSCRLDELLAAESTVEIDVEDVGVVENINTIDQYRRFFGPLLV